jgi:MinD superfamily P-loop ATPase
VRAVLTRFTPFTFEGDEEMTAGATGSISIGVIECAAGEGCGVVDEAGAPGVAVAVVAAATRDGVVDLRAALKAVDMVKCSTIRS